MIEILVSVRNFYPIIGGAELSMYTLAKRLSEEKEVHIITNGHSFNEIIKDQLHIHERAASINIPQFRHIKTYMECKKWLSILDNFVSENRPDMILTQLEFALPSVEIAMKYNIPSALFIRDYSHFCPIGFANGIKCNKVCWRCLPNMNSKLYNALKFGQDSLQYPFSRKLLKWSERTVKGADSVIANSRFVSDLTREWFDVESEYIYPFIEYKSVESDTHNSKFITMIRPDILKGVKIFLDIAKKMPGNRFLCVGKIPPHFEFKSELENAENITYIEWTDDMREVYSKTKVLLVPSIWPEPFGRVCVEAMLNGIPTIVSKRGGLPEVVSNAGIIVDDPFCIEDWVDKINKICSDDQYYTELSDKARERAAIFNFDAQYKKFTNIVEDIIP
jgi:glycosyltransferase involved in cell wall biosynthesis